MQFSTAIAGILAMLTSTAYANPVIERDGDVVR